MSTSDLWFDLLQWRRGWDSNPRDPFGPNGFQDRRFQPLTHPSRDEPLLYCRLYCSSQTPFAIPWNIAGRALS